MSQATIKTSNGILEYTIKTRPRIKSRLYLERDEQGGLVVFAPRHWSKGSIKASLAGNIQRVEKFLNSTYRHPPAPKQYFTGESHMFLGRPYSLAVWHKERTRSRVHINDTEICIVTVTSQREKIRAVLQNWYLRQAREIFNSRLSDIATRAPWVGDRQVKLKLRRMKRTWGNCSAAGDIKLNTHLVKAPLEIIDSVIAHEICHLQEMNHSKAFYALLNGLNPDWREHRAILKAEGINYLLT